MSHIFRDKSLGGSRRHSYVHAPMPPPPPPSHNPRVASDFRSPFGDPAPTLSDFDLRQSAYEILIAACQSSGTRPLTYIPQSERAADKAPASSAPSLQRSLTSFAASKVKKALGMKSNSGKKRVDDGGKPTSLGRAQKAVTIGELLRVQMRVSKQTDSRIRRALLRIRSFFSLFEHIIV